MAINKIITKVDGTESQVIDFQETISGLGAGSHTITVEAYDNTTLVYSQTRNITIAGGGGGGFDPDYQAVLNYATANSIPLPDSTQQNIDNQLLIDYKATGAWALDDAFFKFSGTASIAFKLIDWKRLIQASAFGGLTWDSAGVAGNGSNAYINSLYNPATDAVNFSQNASSFNYTGVTYPSTSGTILGSYDGTTTGYSLWTPYRVSGGDISYSLNGLAITGTRVGQIGFNGLYRNSSANTIAVGNGEKVTNSSSGAPQNLDLYIFARNNEGTADIFWDAKISYLTIGGNKYSLHSAMEGVLT